MTFFSNCDTLIFTFAMLAVQPTCCLKISARKVKLYSNFQKQNWHVQPSTYSYACKFRRIHIKEHKKIAISHDCNVQCCSECQLADVKLCKLACVWKGKAQVLKFPIKSKKKNKSHRKGALGFVISIFARICKCVFKLLTVVIVKYGKEVNRAERLLFNTSKCNVCQVTRWQNCKHDLFLIDLVLYLLTYLIIKYALT